MTGVSTAGTGTETGDDPGFDESTESEEGDRGPESGPVSDTGDEHSSDLQGNLTGLYDGTVDRVVDGEHVVVLVESGGTVVGQEVVPAAEYPSLGEGDPVYLCFLFGSLLAVWPAS